MSDRNQMTDQMAWTIGAIVGVLFFLLLWVFVFGFLGSLFIGAVLGIVVAIVLLMRGRPVGPVPQTVEPHERQMPQAGSTGLVDKGPGPATPLRPAVGRPGGKLPVEARGPAGSTVPEAGGMRDGAVPGGESSERNAEGDLITGADVDRTGARDPLDRGTPSAGRDTGPEADSLRGEGSDPYKVSPPAGGQGRSDGDARPRGDAGEAGSGSDGGAGSSMRVSGGAAMPAGIASGTMAAEAAHGTPAPGGSDAPLAGDEDGAPERDGAGDGAVDAGAPLRDGGVTGSDDVDRPFGTDVTSERGGSVDAGLAGGPGGAGTMADGGAMGADALGGGFGDDGRGRTAGVADAAIADPSAAGGDSGYDPRSGAGFDAGRDAGLARDGFGSGDGTAGVADATLAAGDGAVGEGSLDPASSGAKMDTGSGDLAGSARDYAAGVETERDGDAEDDADRMRSGLMGGAEDAPGAIEPGETVSDIVEHEEMPDVPSQLEGGGAGVGDPRAAHDPAAAAIGDSGGMPSATADPMAVEAETIGSRPEGLSAPRDGGADDLKMIKGVGPKLEEMLNGMGIYHFDQVAGWGADEVAWCDSNLKGFKGRVTRDDWVEQAKLLASGAETEFSRRAERDDIYGEDG